MNYYLFSHPIKANSSHVDDLIEFVNTTKGSIKIGISSGGGDVGISLFLLDMLNANKDRIHLVGIDAIFSSAFDIWVGFCGVKSVTVGTMGMTHMGDTKLRITEKGEYLPEEEIMLQNAKSFQEITKNITFPVMTAAQIKRYEEGKDVYLPYDNLKKIAAKHNALIKPKKQP